ncbi:hypothetical protein PHMEG_00022827 [Phytophthora megakarya]|uniref:Uncharacterized protein n=1 Tax=Phytophthora megakarya TaxID=4795 RepID=A0A225VK38_9STRA|nr:hypothetical protein PHMEG_00022827 [Phytophthora megakarya]
MSATKSLSGITPFEKLNEEKNKCSRLAYACCVLFVIVF